MRKRSVRFILSFSPEEKRQLERLAASEGGLSQAAVLRRLLYKELVRKGMQAPGWSPSGEAEADHDAKD